MAEWWRVGGVAVTEHPTHYHPARHGLDTTTTVTTTDTTATHRALRTPHSAPRCTTHHAAPRDSCLHQNKHVRTLQSMADTNPTVLALLGDNLYNDASECEWWHADGECSLLQRVTVALRRVRCVVTCAHRSAPLCLSASLPFCLSLSLCLSVPLSLCLSVSLSLCFSTCDAASRIFVPHTIRWTSHHSLDLAPLSLRATLFETSWWSPSEMAHGDRVAHLAHQYVGWGGRGQDGRAGWEGRACGPRCPPAPTPLLTAFAAPTTLATLTNTSWIPHHHHVTTSVTAS